MTGADGIIRRIPSGITPPHRPVRGSSCAWRSGPFSSPAIFGTANTHLGFDLPESIAPIRPARFSAAMTGVQVGDRVYELRSCVTELRLCAVVEQHQQPLLRRGR